MSGADAVREAIAGATVLAFPQPRVRDSGVETSSHSGGSTLPPDGGGRDEPPAGAEPDHPDIEFALIPMTDLGNAERLAGRYKDRLRYCAALGWIAWDGRRWCRDGADEAVKLAEHATARLIQDEARALANTRHDVQVGGTEDKPIWLSDKLYKWGRATEGAQRLAAMSKRAMAMLAIAVDTLDRDPMRITVLNGTLHVGKAHEGYVVLRDHRAADYITRLAPVVYDPHAEAPLFDRFLDDIQPPDVDALGEPVQPRCVSMQLFLMSWFGYSLTGDTSEQKMVFLYGKGRNGKGVLVNAVTHVAGDYADQIPIESFLDSGRARAGGQATPDIAGLPGVRLLSTSEPKKASTLDEAFLKLFTGGDRMKARHLNKDFFAFTPHAKLTMQGNYRPKVPGVDEGIWSRILLVPFLTFIAPEKRDRQLGAKLQAEASGILNRLLDGLRHWLDHGLALPEQVSSATAQYRADSDPLGRFLEACTVQDDHGRVQATRMHELFAAWAKANGEAVWTIKGLGSALRERGLEAKKSDASFWVGIRLTKEPLDFDQGPISSASRDDGRDEFSG